MLLVKKSGRSSGMMRVTEIGAVFLAKDHIMMAHSRLEKESVSSDQIQLMGASDDSLLRSQNSSQMKWWYTHFSEW